MAFRVKSFDHFLYLREKAERWREIEKHLRQLNPHVAKIVREMLMQEDVSSYIDPDFSRRMYEDYKRALAQDGSLDTSPDEETEKKQPIEKGHASPRTPPPEQLPTKQVHASPRTPSTELHIPMIEQLRTQTEQLRTQTIDEVHTPPPSPNAASREVLTPLPGIYPPPFQLTLTPSEERDALRHSRSPDISYSPTSSIGWEPSSPTPSELLRLNAVAQETRARVLQMREDIQAEYKRKREKEKEQKQQKRKRRRHQPKFSDETLTTRRLNPPATRSGKIGNS